MDFYRLLVLLNCLRHCQNTSQDHQHALSIADTEFMAEKYDSRSHDGKEAPLLVCTIIADTCTSTVFFDSICSNGIR